jgi:glycogen operon protein
MLGLFASRICGSADIYAQSGRGPEASINFVTCHDGFTLNDLVSYRDKHNEANGENNHDGTNDNFSDNCGAEGETTDAKVEALRKTQIKNFLLTLLISRGVPMLLGGDEFRRTQGGNNNAYCQDNDVTWLDWEHADRDLLGFVRRVGALRRRHPVFRRRRWFQGKPLHGEGASDIAWFAPTGEEMSDADWSVTFARCVGVFLNGDVADTSAQRVEQSGDGSFFLVLNAFWEGLEFVVPDGRFAQIWSPVIDTARETDPFFEDVDVNSPLIAGDRFYVEGRSAVLLGPRPLADDDR